ncbi:MAG: right-handed parallel beta-helix repeat-containing protein [Promethearchaeota archaeon]
MKKNSVNLLLFFVTISLLIGTIPLLSERKIQKTNSFGFNLETSDVSWDVSDYTEFIGPALNTTSELVKFRIYIRDDDPEYNWTKTEAENEWCTGSGTEGDPYVIENLYINAYGEGGGLYIRNTDKHFIVRNCWVNNSGPAETDAGVLMRYTENGNISNNIFSYIKKGVQIEYSCKDIIIENNYMIGDPAMYSRAFEFAYDCVNIDIIGNKIFNFYEGGYFDLNIVNLTLRRNYITNTVFKEWEDSPMHFRMVNDSKVIYNTLDGVYAQSGVFVDVLGGTNNTVFNNSIVSGGGDKPTTPLLSSGLHMSASNRVAMNLEDCNFNLVAHNRIFKGSALDIPSYDSFIVIGLIGVISATLIIKFSIRKLKP